jgi:hypothetical protein
MARSMSFLYGCLAIISLVEIVLSSG